MSERLLCARFDDGRPNGPEDGVTPLPGLDAHGMLLRKAGSHGRNGWMITWLSHDAFTAVKEYPPLADHPTSPRRKERHFRLVRE